MTTVVTFPLARRAAYVKRHAARMAALPQGGAERYLGRQIDIQRIALERKGIAPAALETELNAVERAIRSAAARFSGELGVPEGAE